MSDALQLEYQPTSELLKRCLDIGLFKKRFGLKCPECGALLCEVESLQSISKEPPYCPICEDVIDERDIDFQNDVILLFSLNAQPPFQKGQQDRPPVLNAPGGTAVHVDSLDSGVQYQLVTYDDLFCIQDSTYKKLRYQLDQVQGIHATTTEQGASLENFISNLFSLCVLFRATTGHRTQTNQIDTMVRVKGLSNCALLNRLGSNFYIECKNENKTPTIDYLQKFRGILHDAGMSFGVFVSKRREPRTYKENVNHIYLKDDLVIVCFDFTELEELLTKRINLLECLDKKITEVTTNASHSLGCSGLQLYDA